MAKLVPAADVRKHTKSIATLRAEEVDQCISALAERIEAQRSWGYFEYTTTKWEILEEVADTVRSMLVEAGYGVTVSKGCTTSIDGRDHINYQFFVSWA